ncbi:hypothetical protein HpHA238_04970 [Helicobacter pylori]
MGEKSLTTKGVDEMMQTTPTACKIRRILGLSERLISSKKPLKNTSDSPKKTKGPLKGVSKGSK